MAAQQQQEDQHHQQQQYPPTMATIPPPQPPPLQPYPHQYIPPPSHPQPLPFPYAHPQHSYHPHHHPHPHHQYGSIPQYPIPPQNNYSHHYPDRPTSKRPREPLSDASEAPATKRQALGNDVLFRVVVPSSQIGKVIGKSGSRVQKVRDNTKAAVKIADPIARYEERVVIISSKANDGDVTGAEKALVEIASLILADDGGSTKMSGASAAGDVNAGHVPANSLKLLIAGSQAGGLIGVSGQNIEKLRNSSDAMVTVLAPNQLPMCASAHESDRLVQISGEISAVLKAVEEIGAELRANPPNQVISISPTYNLSVSRGTYSYMDPNAAEYVTLDMVISETMIGGLIGRAGTNIARIRNESGAMVKVFGGKGEQKHRQIQLIGTAQQVALAKQRVDEYIYTQLTQ